MTHVALLVGGRSAEREVSLTSGRDVERALRALGHRVTTIDVGDVAALVDALTPPPDVVFNALHGRWGEDGCVQGLLELLGIPYTHSGVLASALAMDKQASKRLFACHGIRCPEGEAVPLDQAHRVMAPPYVVKPRHEGSSVGVTIVMPGDNAAPIDPAGWAFGPEVLVERYIPGREITCAVMGDRSLGVLEIRPRQGFYDYETKYMDGKAEHLVPAPLSTEVYAEVERVSMLAHRVLGCRGVTRCDLRYDDTTRDPGLVYLLELNTQPGMTPLSLVPEIAAHAGMDFRELVAWMIEEARCDA